MPEAVGATLIVIGGVVLTVALMYIAVTVIERLDP